MEAEARNKLAGHLSMTLSTIWFGLNIPVLKDLMPHWLNGLDATFLRIVGGCVLFWIASLFVKGQRIEKSDWWLLIVTGVVGQFAFILFLNLAIQYTSPIDVSIIMTTPPLMVILASAWIYKIKLTVRKVIGVIVALCGALLLILLQAHGTDSGSMKGTIFCVISAICYAIYLLGIKKPSEKYRSIPLLRWLFLFGSLVCIPVTISSVLKAPVVLHPEAKPIWEMVFIVIFPTFVAYLLIPPAVRRIGAPIVSMYQYLIPVVASAGAIAMGLAKLRWDQPVALIIILFGVFLTSYTPKPKANVEKKDTNNTQ
ncbi:MAG: DMT family transporter [Marinifilaceae bacterium]